MSVVFEQPSYRFYPDSDDMSSQMSDPILPDARLEISP